MAKSIIIAQAPDYIENPAAYEAAIAANIKRNAAKTRRAKWFTVEGNERLYDWLNEVGEFGSTVRCSAHTHEEHMVEDAYDPSGKIYMYCDCCQTVHHPLVKGMFSGDFGKVLLEMKNALDEWGGLTDKQTELVRNALTRAEKWEAERQAKYAAQRAADAQTQHVGEVGKRQEFEVTVERVHSYETDYGTTYINVCRDANNNVVVYKGSNRWNKGETLKVEATVKAHEMYEGVPQTMIQRPTVLNK